jgi:hypothetical protein
MEVGLKSQTFLYLGQALYIIRRQTEKGSGRRRERRRVALTRTSL